MSYYRKATIFENKHRKALLESFLDLIRNYENNCEYSNVVGRIENDEARLLRGQINRSMNASSRSMAMAGVGVLVQHQDPPMIGGRVQTIDIVQNIFNLADFQMSIQVTIDRVERAIGVYEADASAAKVRTFNPFWWTWRLLEEVSYLPFRIIGSAGFNGEKLAASTVGRIVRTSILGIELTAALLTIYVFASAG